MKSSHISISEINNLFNTQHSEIKITGASLDTRTLKKGNIFFAIKGKNNDGHKFINQAEKKGASIAFVQKINSKSNLKQIKVKNTLSAILSLAKYYRSLLNTQVIGITGSVGKTGTKDAISFILKEHQNIFCSRQSYNNKYGMPLEILNMQRKTKFDFFELGMNHYGEIKRFTSIIKTYPLEYKNLLPVEKKLNKFDNQPKFSVEFFENQKNIKNISCYSNEGDKWEKSKVIFNNNTLIIKFREAFLPRRGRVNCSLNDEGKWRWFGTQFIITDN